MSTRHPQMMASVLRPVWPRYPHPNNSNSSHKRFSFVHSPTYLVWKYFGTSPTPHHAHHGAVHGVSPDVSALIHQYAHSAQTATSLQTLMKTGRGEFLHKTFHKEDLSHAHHQATDKILIQVAGFLRHELPIRLAHRVLDLDRVPLMRDMKSVQTVKDLYITSFLELLSMEKKMPW